MCVSVRALAGWLACYVIPNGNGHFPIHFPRSCCQAFWTLSLQDVNTNGNLEPDVQRLPRSDLISSEIKGSERKSSNTVKMALLTFIYRIYPDLKDNIIKFTARHNRRTRGWSSRHRGERRRKKFFGRFFFWMWYNFFLLNPTFFYYY